MFYEQHINEQFEVLLFKISFYLYWLGCYTSATSKEWDPMRNNAFRLSFGGSYLTIKTEDKSNGYSVRLVQDAPCEVEDDD